MLGRQLGRHRFKKFLNCVPPDYKMEEAYKGKKLQGHNQLPELFIHIYHIFFIHSSIDGRLGCFHILAIVNNAVMNIGVHVSFQISVFVFFGYILRSGIAGSYGSSTQFFEEPPYCFPQWLHQFTFPPTEQKGFLFSTSSPFVICGLFDDSHSDRYEVISHCGFDLRFSDD